MKTTHMLSRLMLQGFFVILCLFTFQPEAQALSDPIGKLADVLDEMGPASPFKAYGVDGSTLRESKSFFVCLDNGTDPIVCLDNAQNTELGQKLSGQADIPSWFWKLVHVYIAFKTSDYWGVVENLGEAAVCIVAHFFTTVDVCGLLEDLYQAAQDAYEAVVAAVEWVADVSEAIWNALSGAACSLGLGGCDDPPPPPPPQDVAFAAVFAPVLTSGEGLKKREDNQLNVYSNLLTSLRNQARSAACNDQCVDIAMGRFVSHLDVQWIDDIANRVRVDLSAQRSAYNNPDQIRASAQQHDYSKVHILDSCLSHFSVDLPYAHVDRWINGHPTENAAGLNLKTHSQWCLDAFWNGNKPQFATVFKNYLIQENICKSGVNSLLCDSIPHYDRCRWVLRDVGEENKCKISDEAKLAMATLIYDEMVNAGSTHVIKPVKPKLSINDAKIIMESSRPVTRGMCKYLYGQQKLSNHYPKEYIECTLKEDQAYINLRNEVAQKIAVLNGQYANVLSTDIDPLLVWIKPKAETPMEKIVALAAALNQAGIPFYISSLGAQDDLEVALNGAGVSYGTQATYQSPNFDGLESPRSMLAPNTDIFKPRLSGMNARDKVKNSLTKDGKPKIDPVNQLSRDALKDKSSLQFGNQASSLQAKGVQGVRTNAGVSASTLAGNTSASAKLTASAKGGLQVQQKMQTGNVANPGTNFLNGPGSSSQQTPLSAPMPLPDLTATDTVTIAGKTLRQSARWNTPVALDAKEATRTGGGMCSFAVQYSLRNLGSGPAMSFKSVLTNSATRQTVVRTWNGIAANATSAASDSINLKPGQNQLTLAIQVNEPNQTNNQLRLPVTLNGTCTDNKGIIVPMKR